MTPRRALLAAGVVAAATALIEGHLRPRWVASEDARELRDAMRDLRRCVARVAAHPSAPAAQACDGVAAGVVDQLERVAIEARHREALIDALQRVRASLADGEAPAPDDVARLDATFATAARGLPQ